MCSFLLNLLNVTEEEGAKKNKKNLQKYSLEICYVSVFVCICLKGTSEEKVFALQFSAMICPPVPSLARSASFHISAKNTYTEMCVRACVSVTTVIVSLFQ